VIPVVVAVLAIGWLALLIVAPLAPTAVATWLYAIGGFICHQRSERSFHIEAAQLPVCARCLGIYAGAAVGAVWRLTPGADPALRARPVLMASAVPTLVTLLLEWADLWAATNLVRAVAGVPLGLAAAFVLIPRLKYTTG
jgi:uncharacterized membrane protein